MYFQPINKSLPVTFCGKALSFLYKYTFTSLQCVLNGTNSFFQGVPVGVSVITIVAGVGDGVIVRVSVGVGDAVGVGDTVGVSVAGAGVSVGVGVAAEVSDGFVSFGPEVVTAVCSLEGMGVGSAVISCCDSPMVGSESDSMEETI